MRAYLQAEKHDYFEDVKWVQCHGGPDNWVVVVETGTLGYYHDRTVNLDGEVDRMAFEYRRRNRISAYVIHRDAKYILSRDNLAHSADKPCFVANYELLVHDPVRKLAALGRRSETVNAVPAPYWPAPSERQLCLARFVTAPRTLPWQPVRAGRHR